MDKVKCDNNDSINQDNKITETDKDHKDDSSADDMKNRQRNVPFDNYVKEERNNKDEVEDAFNSDNYGSFDFVQQGKNKNM